MQTKIRLKRFLARKINAVSLFQVLASISPPVAIIGSRHELLFGAHVDETLPRYPIFLEKEPIGWVVGHKQAEWAAAFLTHMAYREFEVNALADNILDLYREINLLYNLAEKLGASLDSQAIMTVVLEEANRLIDATSGAVLLRVEGEAAFRAGLTFGGAFDRTRQYRAGMGIIGHLAHNEKGEIVNEVASDTRKEPGDEVFGSLIGVPFKAKQQLIGMLVLTSQALLCIQQVT